MSCRGKASEQGLSNDEADELESVIQKYRERKVELDARQNRVIADVRDIVKTVPGQCHHPPGWRPHDRRRHDGLCAQRPGHIWSRRSRLHSPHAHRDLPPGPLGAVAHNLLLNHSLADARLPGLDPLAGDGDFLQLCFAAADHHAVAHRSPDRAVPRVPAESPKPAPISWYRKPYPR